MSRVLSPFSLPPGMTTVPDWRDIMAMSGNEKTSGVRDAAWHVWTLMSGIARRNDDGKASVARMVVRKGRPEWSESEGTQGWRWDGVMTHKLDSLWPELASLYAADRSNLSDDERLALSFRSQVGRWLKYSGNVVCLFAGSPRAVPPKMPQWFIRKEWNPEPPVYPSSAERDDGTPATPPAIPPSQQQQQQQQQWQTTASRLSPAEAGETKEPAQVSVKWKCRIARCGLEYTTEGNRNSHERDKHPDEIRKIVTGLSCDDCGDGPFTTAKGLRSHQNGCLEHLKRRRAEGTLAQTGSVRRETRSARVDDAIRSQGEAAAPAGVPDSVADPVSAIQQVIADRERLIRENDELRKKLARWEQVGETLAAVMKKEGA